MNSELYWRMLLFLLTYIHVGKWMTTVVFFYNQFRLFPVMFSNKFNFDYKRLFFPETSILHNENVMQVIILSWLLPVRVTITSSANDIPYLYSPHTFQIIADTERAIRVGVTCLFLGSRPVSAVYSILP